MSYVNFIAPINEPLEALQDIFSALVKLSANWTSPDGDDVRALVEGKTGKRQLVLEERDGFQIFRIRTSFLAYD